MEYRWLLPFTYGVDHHAIETVVRLADARGATLVPVALISASSGRRSPGTRLEHIQQAKDFLVLVQSIAARHHVLVECHEVFTASVNRCIKMLIQDLLCDSVVAVTGADQALLLQKQELSDLLAKPPAALVLARAQRPPPSIPLYVLGLAVQAFASNPKALCVPKPVPQEGLPAPTLMFCVL